MNSDQNHCDLPNIAAAWVWTCQCFGIGEKDLQQNLRRLRRHAKPPDEHFPMTVSRTTFSRARKGTSHQGASVTDLCREALYDRILRNDDKPQFAFTADMIYGLTVKMLRLYEKLLPRLRLSERDAKSAMWMLVEHVFAPTFFIETIRHWQRGLGAEFCGKDCWYLPRLEHGHGRHVKPVANVLDRWLRTAGFRTAYGVGKKIGSESLRREADRWRLGEEVPPLAKLHELVERFANEVAWLDSADDWKARFLVASAAQRCCDGMDEFFGGIVPDASLRLAELIRDVPVFRKRRQKDTHILCKDDDGLLTESETFFAVRLLQRRLVREGKWEALSKFWQPQSKSSTPAPDIPDKELEQWRRERGAQMNPANRFLEFIDHCTKAESDRPIRERIFGLGVQELNRILAKEKAGGQEARRP